MRIQCDQCRKEYEVNSSLRGKKVRCRNCGSAILVRTIEEESNEASDGVTLGFKADDDERAFSSFAPEPAAVGAADVASAAKSDAGDSTVGRAAAALLRSAGMASTKAPVIPVGEPEPVPPAIPALKPPTPSGPPPVAPARHDDPFASMAGMPAVRLKRPIRYGLGWDFPQAAYLDQFGMPAILLISIVWMIFASGGDLRFPTAGMSWAIWLLPLALYGAVGFPLTMLATRMSAELARFELPRGYGIRQFCGMSIGAAIVWAFWLGSPDLTMLAMGAVVAFIAVGLVMWLVLRMLPMDLAFAMPTMLVAVLLATFVSAGAVFGLNRLVLMGMQSRGNNVTYLASPLGPGLYWTHEAADQSDDGSPAARKPVLVRVPDGSPRLPDTVPVTPPNMGPATPTTPPATQQVAPPAWEPATPPTPVPVNPPVTPPVTPPTGPGVAANPDALPVDPANVLVKSKTYHGWTESASKFYLLNAANPVLIWQGEGNGSVQFFRARVDRPRSLLPDLRMSVDNGAPAGYWVCEDGSAVLQFVSFPKPAIQVLTFGEAKGRLIPLTDPRGWPEMGRFDSLTRVLTALGGKMELRDLTAPRITTVHSAPPGDLAPGNHVFSTDGKFLAVYYVDSTTKKPMAAVLDATTGRVTRPRSVLDMLPDGVPVKPAGTAFTPDGGLVCMFDRERAASLLVVFDATTGKKTQEHLFAAGIAPDSSKDYFGRAVQMLADGKTALVYGKMLVDLESGRVLGPVTPNEVIAALPGADGSVHLVERVNGRAISSTVVLVEKPAEAVK